MYHTTVLVSRLQLPEHLAYVKRSVESLIRGYSSRNIEIYERNSSNGQNGKLVQSKILQNKMLCMYI